MSTSATVGLLYRADGLARTGQKHQTRWFGWAGAAVMGLVVLLLIFWDLVTGQWRRFAAGSQRVVNCNHSLHAAICSIASIGTSRRVLKNITSEPL